jgi:hypothetical protein
MKIADFKLIGDRLVAFINMPIQSTMIGDYMKEQGHTGTVCCWHHCGKEQVKAEFRGPDSLRFATGLGGGGHKEAAGAYCPAGSFHAFMLLGIMKWESVQ